uniref:Uncharacterized protein n=1 Tax=Vitis vinifera TaxID=29760 RepID=A5B738_VITVI|nr:hypothetical protein VITISV_030058 [Vitis vinifera]
MSVENIRKLQEKFRCTVQNGDLVVNIIRDCFLIVGGNESGESRVSDEPSCPGNLNCRLRMLSRKGGMSAGQNSSPGGMSYVARHKGDRLRVQGVETPPPDDTEHASLSGATPSRFLKRTSDALPYPDSLKEKHTTLANNTPQKIAYPIRICCLDH